MYRSETRLACLDGAVLTETSDIPGVRVVNLSRRQETGFHSEVGAHPESAFSVRCFQWPSQRQRAGDNGTWKDRLGPSAITGW